MDRTLRQFLNTLSDWVWEMDIHGIHTYSNGAVKEILGYEPEELLGKHVSMFWPTNLATPERIKIFNEELKDGDPWQGFRGHFKHKDGHIMILESSGEPLYDSSGALVGFRGVDRDISETLAKEAALEESTKAYKELAETLEWENNFKTLLLDIISHDILNPANVINGFSELLKDEYPDNEMIATIQHSSRRLMEVIANARAMTQISLDEKIDLKTQNLRNMIVATCKEFKSPLERKGIELQIDIPDEIMVSINPIIAEVFKNYISNALKYASGTQQITVNAIVQNDCIHVSVCDQGPTIPEADREQIFKRGVQLDKTRGGGGLGLAIVKRIAEAHNAAVGVRPLSPQGNAFFIQFGNCLT